jgi:hypothetical protein
MKSTFYEQPILNSPTTLPLGTTRSTMMVSHLMKAPVMAGACQS